jgi:hypothetical protein
MDYVFLAPEVVYVCLYRRGYEKGLWVHSKNPGIRHAWNFSIRNSG